MYRVARREEDIEMARTLPVTLVLLAANSLCQVQPVPPTDPNPPVFSWGLNDLTNSAYSSSNLPVIQSQPPIYGSCIPINTDNLADRFIISAQANDPGGVQAISLTTSISLSCNKGGGSMTATLTPTTKTFTPAQAQSEQILLQVMDIWPIPAPAFTSLYDACLKVENGLPMWGSITFTASATNYHGLTARSQALITVGPLGTNCPPPTPSH
jgi:hypothetical protein